MWVLVLCFITQRNEFFIFWQNSFLWIIEKESHALSTLWHVLHWRSKVPYLLKGCGLKQFWMGMLGSWRDMQNITFFWSPLLRLFTRISPAIALRAISKEDLKQECQKENVAELHSFDLYWMGLALLNRKWVTDLICIHTYIRLMLKACWICASCLNKQVQEKVFKKCAVVAAARN